MWLSGCGLVGIDILGSVGVRLSIGVCDSGGVCVDNAQR